MMNVLVAGSFPLSGIVCNYLSQQGFLKAVCVEKKHYTIDQITGWRNHFESLGIPFVTLTKQTLANDLACICADFKIDTVFVCGFSMKIPSTVLDIPQYGFLNIHFGKLPQNRGSDPVFWTLKNREINTAISVFRMDASWDTGAVLLEYPVPVILGETWGMLNSKLSLQLKNVLIKSIDLIVDENNLKPQENTTNYNNKPTAKALSIDWETQTSDDIEALINACNPKYGGATTYYQGGAVHILEASPVDSETPMSGRVAGEIIHAHPQEGLFVCCKHGQFLRINILKTDAGILTGGKYVSMGIGVGHHFTTESKSKLVTNQ